MPSAHDRLVQFLDQKMRMSQIYQPVMLEVVLTHDGRAPIGVIGTAILAHDESQIDYYTEIVKRMPGRVLSQHGIVRREGAEYALSDDLPDVSEAEREDLVTRRREKVERFKQARAVLPSGSIVGRRPGSFPAVCATTRSSVPGVVNSAGFHTRSGRSTSITSCPGLKAGLTIPTTCRLYVGDAIRTRAPAMRPISAAFVRAMRRESRGAHSASWVTARSLPRVRWPSCFSTGFR